MAKNIKRSEIGEILVKLRNQSRFDNQQELADALGIKRDTYARYETDTNPPIPIIIKLCKLYGVSSDVIIGNDTSYLERIQNIQQYQTGFRQYVAYTPSLPENYVSLEEDEYTLIERYRRLSEERQEALLTLLGE